MSDDDDDFYRPDPNRTWWERNAIPVMGLISLVMFVFVIVFTTSC